MNSNNVLGLEPPIDHLWNPEEYSRALQFAGVSPPGGPGGCGTKVVHEHGSSRSLHGKSGCDLSFKI
ncbi:MAG: hypothetical protein Hals2KO_12890 [Halioglobus sp.]